VSIPISLAVTEIVLFTSPLSTHARLCLGTILVFMVVMGLIAKHRMEHQQRREYLRGLLASLRYDDLVSDTDTLRILAEEDGLTGLLNRRAINVRLARTIEHCRKNGSLVGVMLIDVDFFKMYNDVYGHVAGDACLRNVAQILKAQFRSEDIVGRYGGEEFIAVVRDRNAQACAQLAERVRRAIVAAGIHAPSPSGCVTASFGVACVVPGPDCMLETLLELADQELYAAKRSGRNRVSPPPRELV
jgi:diguanylate cyclase (GGDEF)-like protein